MVLGSRGGVAEWFKAAVLKTVEGQHSGGSNPSLSAIFYFVASIHVVAVSYHITDIRDGIGFLSLDP